jgi:hypothetical protein
MKQFVQITFLVRQVTEYEHIGRTCLGAGGVRFSMLQPLAITKITLID